VFLIARHVCAFLVKKWVVIATCHEIFPVHLDQPTQNNDFQVFDIILSVLVIVLRRTGMFHEVYRIKTKERKYIQCCCSSWFISYFYLAIILKSTSNRALSPTRWCYQSQVYVDAFLNN